ncbi:helix-turn-helix transcriptional regulator [Paenibacillus peoriae]|uniref:Helix-turn-helix transcriptional regulator n=2 Tax=Paenibacillus TaxID=44249 RepID=A0A7H0YFC7_9BACL|nr:helix-turn-helix transcriptional regulator [Paenibacillus peoriae]QNR69785.1 helix-turn-helix transcriptional regulator [Paenibacillus peoriae]
MTHSFHPVHSPKLQPELQQPWYNCREYPASPQLESHVASFWTMDYRPVPDKLWHRVIPDGCVDIVVNLLSPFSRKAAYVVGPTTRSELLQFSEPRSLFGIRIYSESARSILKTPLSAFKGQRIYLDDVLGLEEMYWVEEILSATTISEILAVAEHHLVRMLATSDMAIPPLVYQSLQIIYGRKGNLSVTNLANQVHFSERHLRRVFDQELGLSPKEMLGIIRFQSTLQDFFQGGYSSLVDLSLKYGYYDESHFTNTFKQYYGLSLKSLISKRRKSPIFPI